MTHIGDYLKGVRKSRKLSQSEFSRQAISKGWNLEFSVLRIYEIGRCLPREEQLPLLASSLDLDLEMLKEHWKKDKQEKIRGLALEIHKNKVSKMVEVYEELNNENRAIVLRIANALLDGQ